MQAPICICAVNQCNFLHFTPVFLNLFIRWCHPLWQCCYDCVRACFDRLRSIFRKKIAMSIRCHDRDCTSSCWNQACSSVVFVCSRMPAISKRRLVLGRPPVRPSVFWLLTGPRESPPWGGGVMGDRRAETAGRRAHTHVCPSLHLPHTPPPRSLRIALSIRPINYMTGRGTVNIAVKTAWGDALFWRTV